MKQFIFRADNQTSEHDIDGIANASHWTVLGSHLIVPSKIAGTLTQTPMAHDSIWLQKPQSFVQIQISSQVLVTPDRLTAIRERMLEYLGECSATWLT